MNYCVNHPDAVVTAYCQNCGKGLCSACTRTVQGNVYCEPCMTARAAGGPAVPPGGYTPPPPMGPNVGTATMLGFIPGVGAMYNGQYIKAIVHVVVFIILVGMADRYGFFGILIAFWVIYQVFDAHQTAKARLYGLPLPDPFGLNELGNRIAGHAPIPPVPPASAGVPPPGTPGANPYADWGEHVSSQAGAWGEQVGRQAEVWGQQVGEWGEQLRARIVNEAAAQGHPGQWSRPPAPGFTATTPPPAGWTTPPGASAWGGPGNVPPVPPIPPVPPMPPVELDRARREPIGAIVLILLGMLFLLNTMGFFSFGWIGHGWPWIVVIIAVWLLVRNGQNRFTARFAHHPNYVPPGQAAPGPVAAAQETKQPGEDK
jgi:hypothetical protein